MIDIHVLPVKDLRPHDEVRQCWCRPRLELIGGDGAIVVHHSADGREHFDADAEPIDRSERQ